LPDSTYKAKKVLCPLGLEVQKIHACINDCILYRGEEYENLEACPVCTALRYKIRRDDPGDVDGEPPRKRVPAKVMWYAPIIPRLKRLTTRNLLTSDPSFWSLDGHCCSTYDPLLTKNTWSAVERH
jgi:hypothetical protein